MSRATLAPVPACTLSPDHPAVLERGAPPGAGLRGPQAEPVPAPLLAPARCLNWMCGEVSNFVQPFVV